MEVVEVLEGLLEELQRAAVVFEEAVEACVLDEGVGL